MDGYDPSFLGIVVALPFFSEVLRPQVLAIPPGAFTDPDFYLSYKHYSVATNAVRRQPIVVALNVDQDKIVPGTDRIRWRVDSRIGNKYQLDNDYYRNNAWDRGHLARRSSAAWGDDFQDAQAASDATMFYTNAVLQADTLNQDEWLALENYVKTLESDSTNKISVFSGPIYGDERSEKKFLSVAGHEPAEIPAAFFKVVVFIDRAGRLATRAFIMVQDTTLLSDKNGARSRMFDLQTFQVTVRMIEEETGLVFPPEVAAANPLFFNPSDAAVKAGATDLPEIFPVNEASDLIGFRF